MEWPQEGGQGGLLKLVLAVETRAMRGLGSTQVEVRRCDAENKTVVRWGDGEMVRCDAEGLLDLKLLQVRRGLSPP